MSMSRAAATRAMTSNKAYSYSPPKEKSSPAAQQSSYEEASGTGSSGGSRKTGSSAGSNVNPRNVASDDDRSPTQTRNRDRLTNNDKDDRNTNNDKDPSPGAGSREAAEAAARNNAIAQTAAMTLSAARQIMTSDAAYTPKLEAQDDSQRQIEEHQRISRDMQASEQSARNAVLAAMTGPSSPREVAADTAPPNTAELRADTNKFRTTAVGRLVAGAVGDPLAVAGSLFRDDGLAVNPLSNEILDGRRLDDAKFMAVVDLASAGLTTAVSKTVSAGAKAIDEIADMVRPHRHHIVFKKGIGDRQQALVREGQDILQRFDIDPINGAENITIAPNVKGQHTYEALEPLVDRLKKVGADPETTREDIVDVLEAFGQIAAERK